MGSKFLFPFPLPSSLPYTHKHTFSFIINHIRKDKLTWHQESFMILLKELFNHIKLIQRLHILSTFLILKEKTKKRVSPFSTFLFQVVGSKGGLMDSINSTISHLSSHNRASSHKARIIWENTKHLPYVVLLASLEGWDE